MPKRLLLRKSNRNSLARKPCVYRRYTHGSDYIFVPITISTNGDYDGWRFCGFVPGIRFINGAACVVFFCAGTVPALYILSATALVPVAVVYGVLFCDNFKKTSKYCSSFGSGS